MSKDLTDVDQFSSPIHVPSGIDSRDHAAEDVELIAQRLANRTHHLNQHAAKKDVSNTFTADQTITGKLTVSAEVITPKVTVSDELKAEEIITDNITPETASPNDIVRIAGSVTVTKSLVTAPGAGHLIASGDEYVYNGIGGLKSRDTVYLPIGSGAPNNDSFSHFTQEGWCVGTWMWALRVAPGAVLGVIEMQFHQTVGSTPAKQSFRVVRSQYAGEVTAPAVQTWESDFAGAAWGAGYHVMSVSLGGEVVQLGDTYSIHFYSQDNASYVTWIRLRAVGDPGPRLIP